VPPGFGSEGAAQDKPAPLAEAATIRATGVNKSANAERKDGEQWVDRNNLTLAPAARTDHHVVKLRRHVIFS
jgi:hypothetical protein